MALTRKQQTIVNKCVKVCLAQRDYYRAVGERDDRDDMKEHALTCQELARLIVERVR